MADQPAEDAGATPAEETVPAEQAPPEDGGENIEAAGGEIGEGEGEGEGEAEGKDAGKDNDDDADEDITELPPNPTPHDLRKIMAKEVAKLKEMPVKQFIEAMPATEKLHNQINSYAEKFMVEIIKQIPEVTPVLKKVGEYDQVVFDKLFEAKTADFNAAGKTPEEQEAILTEMEDRLTESVKVNFDFTHAISYIAGPLTVWRLDACKAVWAGHNEIVNAQKSDKILIEDPNAKKQEAEASEEEGQEGDGEGEDGAAEEEEKPDVVQEEEHVEGELDPAEIAASERPALKEWTKHIYMTDEEDEKARSVICYVRAPPDCLLNDDDLIVSYANSLAAWPNLPGNSEVIGKFVCIRPRHPKVICILEKQSEGDGAGAAAAETEAEKEAAPKPIPWNDLVTQDVTGEDSRYLEVRLSKLPEIVLAPAARIRRDSAELGRGGGKLSSLVDNRVMMTVPQGALKINIIYSVQVQVINQHHAQLLRDQNLNVMAQFIACSPLVIISGPKKILFKPATFILPLTDANPTTQTVIMSSATMPDAFKSTKTTVVETEDNTGSGSDDEGKVKKNEPIVLDPFQRSLLLPKLLAGASSSHAEVTLLTAGLEDSNWLPWTSPEIVEQKNSDICIFNFSRLEPRKILCIKSRTVMDPESLLQTATILERSLSQRMVYFILRQVSNNPSKICLAICLAQNLDKTLGQLATAGYTEGDKPTGPLFIYERQVFEVAFKGNIRPKKGGPRDSRHLSMDDGPMRIAFNSALQNTYMVDVEECDSSAQVACEKFRGFLEVTFQHMVKKPAKKRKGARTVGNKKFVMELETVLLCQLLIKLPKQPSDQAGACVLQPFTLVSKDAVTDDYLEGLARKLLGDTWRRLGLALNMTKTQIQAVGGRAESAGENKAITMLHSWVKNLPLEADRANLLINGLTAIGRNDLAAELRTLNSSDASSPDSSPAAEAVTLITDTGDEIEAVNDTDANEQASTAPSQPAPKVDWCMGSDKTSEVVFRRISPQHKQCDAL
ncbi:Death domain-containing protein 1 [Sparganum proliferum]